MRSAEAVSLKTLLLLVDFWRVAMLADVLRAAAQGCTSWYELVGK